MTRFHITLDLLVEEAIMKDAQQIARGLVRHAHEYVPLEARWRVTAVPERCKYTLEIPFPSPAASQ
jgi:hypothetical protein